MDLSTRIENLRHETLKRIEEAARKGDIGAITSGTKILEETERLSRKLEEITSSLSSIENNGISSEEFSGRVEEIPVYRDNDEPSAKERGKHQRDKCLRDVETNGVHLSPVRGPVYRAKSGKLVGIPYASERKPNRWFLGLPSKTYSSVVLLCENHSKELMKFILPEDFLKRIMHKLSRDDNGQIKFNVFLKSGDYELRLPGEGSTNINSFRDNYGALRQYG